MTLDVSHEPHPVKPSCPGNIPHCCRGDRLVARKHTFAVGLAVIILMIHARPLPKFRLQ